MHNKDSANVLWQLTLCQTLNMITHSYIYLIVKYCKIYPKKIKKNKTQFNYYKTISLKVLMCSSSYLIPFKKILVLLTKDEENRSYAHCQLDSKIVCVWCMYWTFYFILLWKLHTTENKKHFINFEHLYEGTVHLDKRFCPWQDCIRKSGNKKKKNSG